MCEASELRRFVTEGGLQPRSWAMPSLAASDAAVLRGSGGEKVGYDRKVNVCLPCDVSLQKW